MTEIEDELRALGERWTHACQWTQQQLAALQALERRRAELAAQGAQLRAACDDHETQLKQVACPRPHTG